MICRKKIDGKVKDRAQIIGPY